MFHIELDNNTPPECESSTHMAEILMITKILFQQSLTALNFLDPNNKGMKHKCLMFHTASTAFLSHESARKILLESVESVDYCSMS